MPQASPYGSDHTELTSTARGSPARLLPGVLHEAIRFLRVVSSSAPPVGAGTLLTLHAVVPCPPCDSSNEKLVPLSTIDTCCPLFLCMWSLHALRVLNHAQSTLCKARTSSQCCQDSSLVAELCQALPAEGHTHAPNSLPDAHTSACLPHQMICWTPPNQLPAGLAHNRTCWAQAQPRVMIAGTHTIAVVLTGLAVLWRCLRGVDRIFDCRQCSAAQAAALAALEEAVRFACLCSMRTFHGKAS